MQIIRDHELAIVTIYQEAEGEPFEGKVAVGEVIRNRMRAKFFSDGTVAGTVLKALQFSGMNTSAPNRIRSFLIDSEDPVVDACVRAWHASAKSDYAKGAMHYYASKYADPGWARNAVVVAEIGNHKFVIPKG